MVPPKVVSVVGVVRALFSLSSFFFLFLPTVRIAGLKDTAPGLLCPVDCLNYNSYSSCSKPKLHHIARDFH